MADGFIFSSHINFLFFKFFGFVAHAFCHHAHSPAFLREKIRFIFVFLDLFGKLGIFAVFFFYARGNFFNHIKIISRVLFDFSRKYVKIQYAICKWV